MYVNTTAIASIIPQTGDNPDLLKPVTQARIRVDLRGILLNDKSEFQKVAGWMIPSRAFLK